MIGWKSPRYPILAEAVDGFRPSPANYLPNAVTESTAILTTIGNNEIARYFPFGELVPTSRREQANLLMTNVCVPIAVCVSINVNVPVNVNAPIRVDVPIAVYVSINVDIPIDICVSVGVGVFTAVIPVVITVSVIVPAVS